ncbi:AAA family ATPase [Luteococcus japonicus]|nr:AAA family ATPase [Luteococcus japonicus]
MLIVLRGNSGSGKSTSARQLQQELGHPTAVLQQDHFRRVIYREREQDSMLHADLLEVAAMHCLERDQHVVLEGIFNAMRYSPMLERVAAASRDARFYAFDLSFEETARRHATRPQSADFTVEEMASWYHGWQPLPFVEEHRVTAEETIPDLVTRILQNR